MVTNEDILNFLIKNNVAQNGGIVKPKGNNIVFLDTLDAWLEGRRVRISTNTYNAYRSSINTHIRPFFERSTPLMLSDVTREMVQDFVGVLVEKKKSPKTIRKIIRETLQQFFTLMVKEGKLDRNPVELVETPKLDKTPKEGYTMEELKRLMDVIPDTDPWKISIPILLLTGMRRSELLGLTWEDVNFKEKYIFIRKTNVATSGEKTQIKETTKTTAGRRVIPISDYLAELLKYHRYNIQKNTSTLVISVRRQKAKGGKPVEPNNFKRVWNKWTEKAGIRHLGIHAVRHSYVTQALNAGASLPDIQKVVGWSDMRMFQTYEDPRQRANAVRETANKVSGIIMQEIAK